MLFRITALLLCSKVSFGIIGGQPAPNYPFFVEVHSGTHQCGGTLLRLDAVLTAAHCLYFQTENRWASPLDVYVLHGNFATSNNWHLRYYSCEGITVHFKYNSSTDGFRSPFDAAVIKLEDKVRIQSFSQRTFLAPCRLEGSRWRRYIFGAAIGLGLTSANPITRAEMLMETTLQTIDCKRQDFGHQQVFFPGQHCYLLQEASSLTAGDFGGPIVAFNRGKRSAAFCLMGASSFVTICRTSGYFATIFTPASKLKHWLNRIYRDNFTDGFLTTDNW